MTGDGQFSEPSTIRGRLPPTVIPNVQIPVEDGSQLSVTAFPQGHTSSAINVNASSTHRARRASAAEKVLEQLRNKDLQRTSSTSPRSTWLHKPKEEGTRSRAASMLASVAATATTNVSEKHAPAGAPAQASAAKNMKSTSRPHTALPIVPPPSPVNPKGALPPIRPRLSRSPSAPHLTQQQQQQIATVVGTGAQSGPHARPVPQELMSLLDGDHHTDELSVRFEAGWPMLERWLVTIGGGAGNGDYGRVSVIYR